MTNLKDNWANYLKVIGIVIAIVAWSITAYAKFEEHIKESRTTIQLLMLICKNTAKSADEVLDCYDAKDR